MKKNQQRTSLRSPKLPSKFKDHVMNTQERVENSKVDMEEENTQRMEKSMSSNDCNVSPFEPCTDEVISTGDDSDDSVKWNRDTDAQPSDKAITAVGSYFNVSLDTVSELDRLANNIQLGTYSRWPTLSLRARQRIADVIWFRRKQLTKLGSLSDPGPVMSLSPSPHGGDPIVQSVDVQTSATTCVADEMERPSDPMVNDPVFEGVNISVPRRVVKKVSSRFEHTLYGYFLGQRLAFPVVEYFAKCNWGKHGLRRIMMNNKGFFFFKFDSRAGLEAVLEGGPWLIRKNPIILKTWTLGTRLLKEELTRIPIWVKFHDVPIQVFEDEGINLIASFLGKPIMFDSFTSDMCKESWGRSSFARCLIEVNSEVDLVDIITIGVPSLINDDFTKESIRVEYEWKPPRCDTCKIFGHCCDQCPKKLVSPAIQSTSKVATPVVEVSNDGFQFVTKRKKKKNIGKPKATNGSLVTGTSVKQAFRYEPKATKSAPKKTISTVDPNLKNTNPSGTYESPNLFSALVNEGDDNEGDDEDEVVENVYDETTNLFASG